MISKCDNIVLMAPGLTYLKSLKAAIVAPLKHPSFCGHTLPHSLVDCSYMERNGPQCGFCYARLVPCHLIKTLCHQPPSPAAAAAYFIWSVFRSQSCANRAHTPSLFITTALMCRGAAGTHMWQFFAICSFVRLQVSNQ